MHSILIQKIIRAQSLQVQFKIRLAPRGGTGRVNKETCGLAKEPVARAASRPTCNTAKTQCLKMVMPNAELMVLAVASWQRKNRLEWAMKSHGRKLCVMSPLTLLLHSGVGPILTTVEMIGIINRKAWSFKQKVGFTHSRPIAHMIDHTLSGPKLAQANWAKRAINETPHLVLHTMGFELMKSKTLITGEFQRALIALQMQCHWCNNLVMIPCYR